MNTIEPNPKPYIGAKPFQESDRERFFGREQEANELLALALSEQEIVFYAQSGAGKSSLVNTCLIPDLKKKGFEVLLGRVGGDAPSGFEADNIFVFNLLRSLSTPGVDINSLTSQTLSSFLALEASEESTSASRVSTRRALIIDQFEEIFSRHHEAWEKRKDFFEQLGQVLEDDPRLRVILVMREDFIASLDPYANLLPSRLRMRYFMQRLEYPAALKAVTEPVKRKEFSRPYDPGAAEKLVDDLRTIKVIKPDGTSDVGVGQFVEPLYLQVICDELWNKLPEGGTTITKQNVLDIGDVGTALMNLYATSVARVAKAEGVKEAKIRKWFTDKLISPAGIRNMVLKEVGETSANLENRVIQALSDLVRAEQRGGAVFYELTHDRLAQPIITSNRKWFEDHLSALQKRAALWDAEGKTDSWLLSDQDLVEVEEWAKAHSDELTDTENEFLKDCRILQGQIDERQASAKRARLFNIVSSVLIVIALIAVYIANGARVEANNKATEAANAEKEALKQSNIARSSELSTIALERSDSQLDLALLLGVQADSFNSNAQSRKALLALLQKSSRYLGTIMTDEKIEQIQFSPDGKTFASRDKNGVTFWDTETRSSLNTKPINGHFSAVSALAMSDDGRLVASGAADGTTVIWDVAKRIPLSEPFGVDAIQISSLAFSPDGTILASANWDETGDIILWDISDPAKPLKIDEPLSMHTSYVICLDFSPDGKTLASGSSDSTIILWDVETRKPIGEEGEESLTGHSESIYGLAFSPDGKTLASGSYDDTVILWNVSNPEKPEQGETLTGHEVDIETIAISPDGKMLASGDDYGNIFLWDLQTGKVIGKEPLNGKTSWVVSLAFSPDSKTLVAGSHYYDGGEYEPTVILWDVKKRVQIGQTLLDHNASVGGVAFSPDGKTLVTASQDSTILFWDISKLSNPQKIGAPLQGHPGQPTGMSFSPDGSLLASEGYDGTILLDVKTQKQVGLGSILKSPDESILVYQSLDKTTNESAIHLMDNEGKPIGDSIPGQNSFFSPDGQILVYETTDPMDTTQTFINLWSIADAKNIGKDIKGSYVTITSDSSGAAQTLVYQTSDPDTAQSIINLWDIATAQSVVKDIEGSYLALISEGQTLVYQTTDPDTGQYFINVWDIATAQNVGEAIEGNYLAINSDSQTLVFQTSDSDTGETVIILWDLVNAVAIKTIITSDYSVSPNGAVLAFQTLDPESENSIFNLLYTATGEPLSLTNFSTGEPLSEPLVGGVHAWSANGEVLLYYLNDEKGQSTNALSTSTGEGLISVDNSNFNSVTELGGILAYEIYDYDQGEYNFVVIQTDPDNYIYADGPNKGQGLNLIANGGYLIYGPEDGSGSEINLWDVAQRYPIAGPLTGRYIGMYKDNEILVYESVDGDVNNVHLFDVTKQAKIGEPFKGTFVGLSPDGRTLVTLNENNASIFWDVTRTWPLGDPLTEIADNVSSATLSADGKTLAFADVDGIALRDENAAKIIKNDHLGTVTYVSWSTDESTLLTFGNDGKVIAWDLSTSQPLSDPITGTSAYFSPKEKFITVYDDIEKTTLVWDLTLKQVVGKPFNSTTTINFSPEEKYITAFDELENTTTIWDLTSQQAVGTYSTDSSNIVFSPEEKFIAVFDELENTTTVWDLASRDVVAEPFSGGNVTFSSDDRFLAVGDEIENTITLWDLTTRQISGEPFVGQYALFSPDGKMLALNDGDNNTTTLWSLVPRAIIGAPFTGLYDSFHQYGQTLALEGFDYDSYITTTVLFDLTAPQLPGRLFQGYIYTYPEADDIFAIVDTNRNMTTLWDSKTQKPFATPINGTDLSFTGTEINTLIVYDYENNRTTLWNPVTRRQIGGTLPGIYYIWTTSPDGTLMAMNDSDYSNMLILDLKSQKQIGSNALKGYYDYLALCATPDNKIAAWFDPANITVNIWDLENDLSPLGEFELGVDSAYYGVGLTFNASCDVLAIGDYYNGQATLWDLTEKQPVDGIVFDGISSAVFSLDGSIVALGNINQNKTTLWNLTKKQVLGEADGASSTIFSSDGLTVAIGDNNENVTRFWKVADVTQVGEDIQGAYIYSDPENNDIVSIEGYYDSSIGYNKYKYFDLKSLTQLGDDSINYLPLFTSDGTLVVYGDKGVTLWNVRGNSPEMTGELHGHTSPVIAMLFSQDRNWLASLAADGIVLTNLTDPEKVSHTHLKTGKYIGQLTSTMAFNMDEGDESFIALGSDGTILIWEITGASVNPEPRLEIDSPYASAYRSTLSPDGKYLIYENTGNNLYVWEIAAQQAVYDEPRKIEICCGSAITFTPDGKTMFFNDGGTIFKWDQWNDPAKSMITKQSFGQKTFSSLSVVMDPTDPITPKYLLSSYYDDASGNTITQIWDWVKNSKVGDPISGNIQIYGSNVETHMLIYKDNEGRLIDFDLDPATWRNLLCKRAGRNFTKEEWAFFLPENIPYPTKQEDATCQQWPLLP